MRRTRVVAVLLLLSLASCGSEPAATPDVTGERLDVALSDIERAGFDDDVEIVGGGIFGVVDESNWTVCEQSPAAGDALEEPRLTVERSCSQGEPSESDPPSEAPDDESPTPEPTEASPTPMEVVTARQNAEFAALLQVGDNCDQSVGDFARDFAGRVISFDGVITAMGPHGDFDTRFDILISPGDDASLATTGPTFQFRDVNIVSDLQLAGEVPDAIGVDNRLRVEAEVLEFEQETCLFLLDPVSTRVR